MHEQNGYLILEHLSDIELYYTSPDYIVEDKISLVDEEFHHAVNVMRNSIGDLVYITDGLGNLFETKIIEISKKNLISEKIESVNYKNRADKIFFCLPILKNSDRMKFAIEKCVELGITHFIFFSSKHSISKKVNTIKFQKTALAAMKQSIRAFLPDISSANFEEIINRDGNKILFDQHSNKYYDGTINLDKSTYLFFGPEGGFDKTELDFFSEENRFCLSTHRLRSETAIIKCAALLKSL